MHGGQERGEEVPKSIHVCTKHGSRQTQKATDRHGHTLVQGQSCPRVTTTLSTCDPVLTALCLIGQTGVEQAPEFSIAGLSGSMQRGPSLNVPPPVGRTAGGLKGNWTLFWGAVPRDHCHAGLIWNEGTRAELREALQV